MLEELSITNIALIERNTLRFTAGMNCLSGETGAGKSILAGALGLLRGDKGDPELIRTGAEEAVVNGSFLVPGTVELNSWLSERGLETDDGRILIRRILRRQGKSGIYIQGQAFSLKELTDLASMIFDMHGQHEHQSLFNVDNHRLMLDRFGGFQEDATILYQHFVELANLTKQREKLLENERDRQRQQEYLEFAVKEINEAALTVSEDLALEQERRIVSQSERLFSLCAQLNSALSASEGGAMAQLYSARHLLHDIAQIDAGMQDAHGRVENLYYEMEDITSQLLSYQDRAVFDPARLEAIEERLNLIQRLKKKYGSTVEEILTYRDNAEVELEQLENFDHHLGTLNSQIKEIESKVLDSALELSRKRKSAALRLKQVVETSLKTLSMAKTVFEVSFRQKESERGTPVCGPYGIDSIEFLLSSNPGEPLKPLRSVASGGEISRIMLSIKAALSDSDQVSCLVFDEVDTGIGGEVAVALGEHLYKLSRSKQILAITHLASIAVRADNHIKVEKVQRDGRTFTQVETVDGEKRVEEIARMLSGEPSGAASLGHARELLKRYHSGKTAILASSQG